MTLAALARRLLRREDASRPPRSNPLAARFASEPALVAPHARDRFEACLTAAAGVAGLDELMEARASASDDDFWCGDLAWVRPYRVVDGVLRIPVAGVLLSGFPYQLYDWATGYEYILAAYERGLADGNVRGIAFVIDSPGGEVAGNFDLVDLMYGRRGAKPTVAIAAECAYSAAYSIASAADRIVVTRTGGVGSIGVVTSHVDMSRWLDEAGLKVTFVFAGAHKVDGNPYEPLPDAVRARIQARIDEIYGIFAGIVARNRGLDEAAVRATEALTYSAREAVDIGLADEIAPLVDALAAFADRLATTTQGTTMTTETPTPAATTDPATAAPASDASVKDRIKAIVRSDEAKGREDLANHLAFETDMPAEAAVAALKAAPKGGEASDLARLDARAPSFALGGDAGRGAKKSLDPKAVFAARAAARI